MTNEPKFSSLSCEGELPKRKSLTIPIVVGIACLGAFLWTMDHIAGGCTSLDDVFKVCDYTLPR